MTQGRAKASEFVPGTARRPIQHGTIGGYRTHYRHGVPMCEPCRAAERTRLGYKAPQRIAECGTRSGYNRHCRRGEAPCPPCRDAQTADTRRRRTAS